MHAQFAKESVDSIRREAGTLTSMHFDECRYHGAAKDPEPDWGFYFQLEERRMLRVFTVRYEGQMVGYSVFHVSMGAHFSKLLRATQDLVFLVKEHRGLGLAFLAWCDKQLQQEGVQHIYRTSIEGTEFGKVLERLGYNKVQQTYLKEVN